jgi:ketosteroid isomerase-like protein
MSNKTLDELMTAAESANREMLRGNAAPLKALYSRQDDVTVLGGFGGFERGWTEVESRLDWVASNFSEGEFSQELISATVGSEMALIVTIERYDVRVANAATKTHDELRVTQVFRLEAGTWKLIHRHGDPLVRKAAPGS